MSPRPADSSLVIEAVTVGPRSVSAFVRAKPDRMRTSCAAGIREEAIRLLPGLRDHRCRNDEGRPFLEEIANTESAHLLEHVAVELMHLAGSGPECTGRTVWDFKRDGEGVFRVDLAFDNDLVCLGALKAAGGIARYLLDGGPEPDVDATVTSLKATAR